MLLLGSSPPEHGLSSCAARSFTKFGSELINLRNCGIIHLTYMRMSLVRVTILIMAVTYLW